MVLKRHIICILICLLASLSTQAQFFDYGADPSRYKWNKVKLDHYDLIYPRGLDSMAYQYALYLENVYPKLQKTIGEPIKKRFPVILHPGSMSSNGVVSWAPRRMELITTPSIRQEAQRWDKHLVLHESRHVIQTGKVMSGWLKGLYYLVGEQSAGVSNLFLPRWFLEGDAVGVETAMSNAGRGRLPEFNMVYRAQMLTDKKFFSFDKWYLGSYKDYSGNYYALGYDLISYGRYRYGADLWDKVTSRYVVRFPFFSSAIKHHSGVSATGLFHETFSYLRDEWKMQDINYMLPRYETAEKKRYTSYRYPQAINDSTVVAVKSGIEEINSLVSITKGKERRLCYLGSINSRLTYNNNRVYWSEIVSGYRWTHESYSVIKYLDLETGKVTTVTPKQRYLSPSINKEGTIAAASRVTETGEYQLVLVDIHTGEERAVYRTPDNVFIKELVFNENDEVTSIVINDTGIAILQLDISTGEWKELLGTTPANITSPVWHKGKLFFESGLNGTNNIFYLDPISGQTYRQTASRFGAFDPAFTHDGNRLLMSDYRAKGYQIASLPVDSLLHEASDFTEPYRFPMAEELARQEQFNLDSAELKPVDFTPKPYHKLPHVFKIHSWAPFYYDVAEAMNAGADDFSTIVKPGATILSQNTLNTAIMQAGWYYTDGEHHGKLSFVYKGRLPVIDLEIDYGGKAYDMVWEKNEEGKDVLRSFYKGRDQFEAEAHIYIPFNLTTNHYIRGIQPMVSYFLTNNKYQRFGKREMNRFQYIMPELRIYNYRRMAHRDILPRWGYQLRLQYLALPFNTENYGNLYTGRLTTYWPGILKNHGLMLRGGYQYQSIDDKLLFIPKRLLDKTRGYDYQYRTRQQYTLKADYAFSVFSPDLSIGEIMYFRRLRTNLFYDFTRNQASKGSEWSTQSSYGADFIVDWNVLRMSIPLSTGIRLVQPIDYGSFQTEFLFSVTF